MSVIVRSWMLLKVHHILLHFKELHIDHLDYAHREQAICSNECRICALCRRRRRPLCVLHWKDKAISKPGAEEIKNMNAISLRCECVLWLNGSIMLNARLTSSNLFNLEIFHFITPGSSVLVHQRPIRSFPNKRFIGTSPFFVVSLCLLDFQSFAAKTQCWNTKGKI